MKNPRLILQILNLLNGVLLSIYLIKIMGWSAIFNPIKLFHLIIGAFIIYGLKSFIEVNYNTKDPVKTNRYVNAVFFVGAGLFILGIAFKVMHWPFSSLLLIIGVFITISSFVFSFFAPETEDSKNEEILDDF